MGIRCESLDAGLVHIAPAHIEELADVVIFAAGDESEFQVIVVDGHCIGVELVVSFSLELKLCTNLEVLECLASVPIAETCNVKVCLVNSFDFSFHNPLAFDYGTK